MATAHFELEIEGGRIEAPFPFLDDSDAGLARKYMGEVRRRLRSFLRSQRGWPRDTGVSSPKWTARFAPAPQIAVFNEVVAKDRVGHPSKRLGGKPVKASSVSDPDFRYPLLAPRIEADRRRLVARINARMDTLAERALDKVIG